MITLEIFKEYANKKLTNYPQIVYSNLYKKVFENFYFEFVINGEKNLFSPNYVPLKKVTLPELVDIIEGNEAFFDSLKEFILNSLFVYSALIEENSYYLTNSQSILIARVIHSREQRFEVKFYAHYKDELLNTYNDKIYIGRDFINLKKFERKNLGLKKYFLSLSEQDQKMQERAKQMLRSFDEYKKPYLDEIHYLIKETYSEAMDRMKVFPETDLRSISKIKLSETLDDILYMQNLVVELRDITLEFDQKLRLNEENNFVKYLTKFSKDLNDGICYLRKLITILHIKISKFSLC